MKPTWGDFDLRDRLGHSRPQRVNGETDLGGLACTQPLSQSAVGAERGRIPMSRTVKSRVRWRMLAVVCAVAMLVPSFSTTAGARDGAVFGVSAEGDAIVGWGWAADSDVTVEIDDPHTGVNPDFEGSLPTDSEGAFETERTFPFDIQPGHVVEVTDGVTTKSHEVTPLEVTDTDVDADTASGVAAPGGTVALSIWDQSWEVTAVADAGGHWTVDFGAKGWDLQPGDEGPAGETDEDGDWTYVFWRVPNPTIAVRPNGDGVAGWEWAPDDSVHVAIDDLDPDALPDFEFDAPTSEWGEFDEWEIGYDIQAGYTVTVTQGDVTKWTVVTELEVTAVDPDADTVSGTAEPGSEVGVFAWTDEWDRGAPYRMVTADGAGEWVADFSEPADPGTGGPDEDRIWDIAGRGGMAAQWDEDGDSTEDHWALPTLSVRPNGDGVAGWEWAPDDSVHVAIDDLDPDALPDFEFDAPTSEWGDFDEWEIGYDIQAGYTVTVTQGDVTKWTVVTELEVTAVDPDADTVSGTAEPGSEVGVFAWTDEWDRGAPYRMVTADGAGEWVADFSEPADPGTGGPDEDRTWDIVAGSNGMAAQWDEDGDATEDHWQIPNPTIAVRPNGDGVAGWEWAPDDSVHVAIDDLDPDAVPDFEFDAPTSEWGEFDEWEIGYDIQAGYTVTVTQGDVTKWTVVTELEVTAVDPDADTVSGTAEPGSEVGVFAWTDEWDRGAPYRMVTADGAGEWVADFSEPADPGTGGPDEDRTWDIVAGSNGMAAQWDEDGDSTEDHWNVINPSIEVNQPEDWIWGWDWPADTEVHVEVDDPGTVASPDLQFDVTTTDEGYFPEDHHAEVAPGDTVTASDGSTTKTHVVTAVEVTAVDVSADTVSGTAAPGSEVTVEVFDDGELRVTTSGSGSWTADFSGQHDILVGTQGKARQDDEDGDHTSDHWEAQAPTGPVTAERLAGASRYDTAVKLSQEAFADDSVANIVVASGTGFADALSASGLAGAVGSPILLVPSSGTVAASVKAEVERIADADTTVWVVGGTAVVPDAVANQLKVGGVTTIERLAGTDRYKTSATVAAKVAEIQTGDFAGVAFVASGANFPDALAVSPVAWRQGFPVLLTEPSRLTAATSAAITTTTSPPASSPEDPLRFPRQPRTRSTRSTEEMYQSSAGPRRTGTRRRSRSLRTPRHAATQASDTWGSPPARTTPMPLLADRSRACPAE